MNNLFGKKLSAKEQQRENERHIRKATRDIEREKQKLEEEEKKLEREIRRNVADGKEDIVRILAKQLVTIRKEKQRTHAASSKLTSIGYQNKNIGANIALGNVMATTAKAMGDMNKQMRPEAIAGNVRNFQQANMRMEMTEEMIGSTLDDMLAESDDEEATNAVLDKVLDEIGIEISGKMANIPKTGTELQPQQTATEKDLSEQLARLRS